MRIGRSLTITDIDSYITNYISNYELTEVQIATIMANAQGAIGCLSQLVGIDSNKPPITYVHIHGETIPNNHTEDLAIDDVFINDLGAFNPLEPDILTLPTSGLYYIYAEVVFSANPIGHREMWLEPIVAPNIYTMIPSCGNLTMGIHISGLFYVDIGDTFALYVKQTSGGDLSCNGGNLILRRVAIKHYDF